VPGWVPFIGGNSISVPHLPTFHSGGVVGGPVGSPQLALLQGGEQVSSRASAGDDTVHVVVQIDSDVLLEKTARAVRRRNGDPASLGLKIKAA
jgi:hypothetical protein